MREVPGDRFRPGTWVFLAGALAAAGKLFLIWRTASTNDVFYWFQFAEYIKEHGLLDVYRGILHFNHPPLTAYLMWALGFTLDADMWLLTAVVRMFSVAADAVGLWLVWEMARRFLPAPKAAVAASLFALSPVLMLVSGVHGNTDPVFMLFVYVAVYSVVCHRSFRVAGATLGLAMGIKIIPLILIPAFLWCAPDRQARVRFLLGMGVAAAVIYAYPMSVVFGEIVRNVFLYRGVSGYWGLTRFFVDELRGSGVLPLVAAVGAAWLASRGGKGSADQESGLLLVRTVSLTLITFMVFATAFAAQYLTWIVGPMVVMGAWAQVGFGLVSIPFLLLFYANYVGSNPVRRYFDHPSQSQALVDRFVEVQGTHAWPFWDRFLVLEPWRPDLAIWAFLIVVLCVYAFRSRMARR